MTSTNEDEKFDLIFEEQDSKKPNLWFQYKVLYREVPVAEFKTEICRSYALEGRRESVYVLYKIIVYNGFRQRGFGSQILRQCEQFAEEQQLNKVVCWVRSLNKKSPKRKLVDFYKKNGFRFVKDGQDRLFAVKNI